MMTTSFNGKSEFYCIFKICQDEFNYIFAKKNMPEDL